MYNFGNKNTYLYVSACPTHPIGSMGWQLRYGSRGDTPENGDFVPVTIAVLPKIHIKGLINLQLNDQWKISVDIFV